MIKEQIDFYKNEIRKISLACGRNPRDIRLMMVTKTIDADRILEALSTGETLIGENKVQELKEKDDKLKGVDVERHLIGHLQTNKVKDAIKYVTCIQSIDRFSVAKELQKKLRTRGQKMDVLIQVNSSGESSKYGLKPEEVEGFVKQMYEYDQLRVKGLMTIGPLTGSSSKIRASFKLMKELQKKLQNMYLPEMSFDVLSMGMTNDYKIAIEEGSTLIRVGSGIFGERVTKA